MYVESFQAYGGTPNTSDPGYADFRVNINGRRYTGTCEVDGSTPRRLETCSEQRWADRDRISVISLFRKVPVKTAAELWPHIESVLKSYLASRTAEG